MTKQKITNFKIKKKGNIKIKSKSIFKKKRQNNKSIFRKYL